MNTLATVLAADPDNQATVFALVVVFVIIGFIGVFWGLGGGSSNDSTRGVAIIIGLAAFVIAYILGRK